LNIQLKLLKEENANYNITNIYFYYSGLFKMKPAAFSLTFKEINDPKNEEASIEFLPC
jgi:hypothetical protein